jgi:hypothetical protein
MTTTIDNSRWTAVGGVVDETRLTLSVQGIELDPDALTSRLGVTPTRTQRRGEPVGKGRDETFTAGLWSLELRVEAPEEADAVISRLLAMLPEDGAFWAGLQSSYRVRLNLMLVVKHWNRGFQLSASLLQEIARRGLALEFDVYAEPQPMASACLA